MAVVTPVVASIPMTASAQPKKPMREQLPPEARGHWDAGVQLAQKKPPDWGGALASFKSAYDLSKNPKVLFNVAVAQKELHRYAASQETFRRELAEGKGQLSPAEETEIKNLITELDKFVGQLTIEVSERDADVFVDEEKIDATKLPGPIAVQAGTLKVRAVKPGFAEAVESVSVSGGVTQKVSLKLSPLVRTSKVNVSVVGPPNAIVKIDGREAGPAPYTGQVEVLPSPHQFSAEAPGYATATTSALVKEGEALNLTLSLAVNQAKAKLIVVTKPEGAIIEIDGAVVGATRWEGPVDARAHQISVKKSGYYTFNQDVDFAQGEQRTVTASLNEDRNTSFVPWLIGSLVVGAALAVSIGFLASPPDEKPANGSLAPFKVGTQGLRF